MANDDAALALDPKTSALLIMDYQKGILERIGAAAEPLLQRTARVLTTARGAGLPVIYVVVGFRPGYPEMSPSNAAFNVMKVAGRFLPDDPGVAIHPAVAPEPGEVTVTKHRVNAFHGTDLDMILRAGRIETLVLLGVATGGVVLSTLRHAADADYRCLVVEDCCADADPEVHACLTGKVFPRQAKVISSESLIAGLGPDPQPTP
jgi:nicotinamidase-related amidase